MASDLNEQAGLLLFGISLNATREVAPEEKVGKHARPSARARAREGPGRHLDVAGAPPPSVGGGSSAASICCCSTDYGAPCRLGLHRTVVLGRDGTECENERHHPCRRRAGTDPAPRSARPPACTVTSPCLTG